MKPYYELHITYLDGADDAPLEFKGWSHSVIAGDIILGEGRKQYLTKHAAQSEQYSSLIQDMESVAVQMIGLGKQILRTKVELVLYDERRRKGDVR